MINFLKIKPSNLSPPILLATNLNMYNIYKTAFNKNRSFLVSISIAEIITIRI